jgi:hypothetical protein
MLFVGSEGGNVLTLSRRFKRGARMVLRLVGASIEREKRRSKCVSPFWVAVLNELHDKITGLSSGR